MDLETLSEKPFQALEALATYRYLTANQLVDLGIAASPTVARDHVFAKLEKGRKPFAKAHNPGRHIGYGQLPYIHYLTEYGASALAEYYRVPVTDIIYPKGGVQFQRDFQHRLGVIDCHIRFRQMVKSMNAEINISDLYFDKVGSQRISRQYSRTRVDLADKTFIEPDAIFGFTLDGSQFLFALEYHLFPDTGRIVKQLLSHCDALNDGAIAKKYGLNISNYVLSVHDKTLNLVSTRINQVGSYLGVKESFRFFEMKDVRDSGFQL